MCGPIGVHVESLTSVRRAVNILPNKENELKLPLVHIDHLEVEVTGRHLDHQGSTPIRYHIHVAAQLRKLTKMHFS